jgi:hypothetical protein
MDLMSRRSAIASCCPLAHSATGLTLYETNRHLSTFDFTTGEVTLDGAIVLATRPGQGIVVHDVGRLRFGFAAHGTLDFDFAAGNHDAVRDHQGAVIPWPSPRLA